MPKAHNPVSEVVDPTDMPSTSPPNGSSSTSCMLNAAVPQPIASSSRALRASEVNSRQTTENLGVARSGRVVDGARASCFHSAMTLSAMVNIAAPCTIATSRVALKSASSEPITKAAPIMPTSSITNISATTRGRVSSGARSVASARPAVCVVCMPSPVKRNASAPAIIPMVKVSPRESSSSAKGMIARPPNWSSDPNQI